MGKTRNITPDGYQTYLYELIIANQKKTLTQLDRIEQQNKERFDKIEAYIGMSDHEKEKPLQYYTTKETCEILKISRNTLKTYRDKGIITSSKPGKKVMYTIEDINKMKDYSTKQSERKIINLKE